MSFIKSIFGFTSKPFVTNNGGAIMIDRPTDLAEEEKVQEPIVNQNEDILEYETTDSSKLAPSEYRAMQKAINNNNPKVHYKGLISSEELEEFFAEKYFSRGRHNGLNFSDSENLIAGKNAILAKFQKQLYSMIGSREKQIKTHKQDIESSRNSFPGLIAGLNIKVELIQEDIDNLKEQIELSNEYKGWVSSAITEYENGFLQGFKWVIKYH